jgi:hypothetical protein
MQTKPTSFSNFSRTLHIKSDAIRPAREEQLQDIMTANHSLLARGSGLSYSDCCVSAKATIIDTSRLNHILSFDPSTGIAICQGSVTFADLFSLHPDYIPPVLPGTLYATLAGGIANDVHGKNNPHAGTLSHHIEWIELQIGHKTLRCSPTENSDLFKITVAGLGLTGFIRQLAIRLRQASHWVRHRVNKFTNFADLMACMKEEGLEHDYQVAWLDLLNAPQALLSFANHVKNPYPLHPGVHRRSYHIPILPKVIYPFLMKPFNQIYYRLAPTGNKTVPLWQFNNPLDNLKQWNRLYGKKGLIQFQAVFPETNSITTLNHLLAMIKEKKATPTLAVLKYFTQKGHGLLSFTEPGFSIAIDFINNQSAHEAIKAMNQLITDCAGKVYLAKDLLLTQEQFNRMYPKHSEFCELMSRYQTFMHSQLSDRLGIGIMPS